MTDSFVCLISFIRHENHIEYHIPHDSAVNMSTRKDKCKKIREAKTKQKKLKTETEKWQ